MAKDKISDYSSTANSNTDIAGINIDEGCAPSGINDAIRTLMAQLKTWQSGGQDVYIHPAGTASAPSVTANGDTNTGIFFPAADTVGITTGGSERARVDSSGNLGLGVTPSAWASNFKANQIGQGAYIAGRTDAVALYMGSNGFWNGSSDRYIANGFATDYYQASGQHIWRTAASGTAGNAISFTQAMTLDASGNLGLATTSPTARLTIGLQSYTAGATLGMIRFKNDQTTADGCIQSYSVSASTGTDVVTGSNFYVDTSGSFQRFNTSRESSFQIVSRDGAVYWGTGGTGSTATERARIDSSGRLLVGTTTAQGGANTFYTSAGASQQLISLWNAATAGTRYFLAFATEGTYTERGYITWNGSTMALSNASDERLKENIVDAPSALPKIAQMQIRSFDFKEDGRHVEYGVVAQELNQVIPSAVFEGADNEDGSINKPWSVGLEPVIPVLVKAIQEQQTLIQDQLALINSLTARIEALEQA